MPVIRIVECDGFGISVVETAATPRRVVKKVNEFNCIDDARKFLDIEGWHELSGCRNNGDNFEYVFVRDSYK